MEEIKLGFSLYLVLISPYRRKDKYFDWQAKSSFSSDPPVSRKVHFTYSCNRELASLTLSLAGWINPFSPGHFVHKSKSHYYHLF
jgi:hypothetical protein